MLNRRALASSTFSTGKPRFRPIAPKPAVGDQVPQRSAAAAAAAAAPKPSSRKRSSSSASSSSSPSKRLRSLATNPRPLIPVAKPSSKSWAAQHLFPHPELKTLALLPESPAASPAPAAEQHRSQSKCGLEDEWTLTQLSLGLSPSPSSSSASSESSEGEEDESRPRPGCNAALGSLEGSEAMVVSNSRGGIVWCNAAYKNSVSRGEELGLPIPVCSYNLGDVLWRFSKRRFMDALLSLNVCGSAPLRPQPVRRPCSSVL